MLTRRTTFLAATAGLSASLAACATTSTARGAAGFAAWLERYKAAWEARDATQAGALFTVDATYHEMPFDAPMQGRAAIEAYWARVTATQSDVRFTYDVISTVGDQGVAHWHATFKSTEGGATIDLDGIFVCQFADERTVQSLREWWHLKVTPAA